MDQHNDLKIVVEIESELMPIVPEFLENRRKDCDRLEQFVESADYASIRTLGHRMKGAGGSYGFDLISELGELIETAGLAADRETVVAAQARLRDYLDRVEVVYV